MFSEYLFYVHVYEDGEVYKYEYGNMPHAIEHYETELSKGNKAELFRYKDGKMQKYMGKSEPKGKCNCGNCKPKTRIMPTSRARN